MIERFSFECRKVIGFAFTTVRDWFKKLAPLFHPIRSKTKTNRDSVVRVFPHFSLATCNYFVFWLVHLIVCVLCDWLEWFLWFWCYDTQLKIALSQPGLNRTALFLPRGPHSVGEFENAATIQRLGLPPKINCHDQTGAKFFGNALQTSGICKRCLSLVVWRKNNFITKF